MRPIIKAEGVSKCYRIGSRSDVARELRQSMLSAVTRPFRALLGRETAAPKVMADEELWALRDVAFEVLPGEIVGVVGRNGAGKSTLLKILSRITEPTSGRVEVRGRLGALLEVGTGFHPELTGRENVYLNGSILGMMKAEIDSQFDAIVDFAGVSRFIDTPVKRYSSGMHVRLGFAVAAHLSLDILVVDEVLAVGDAAFQKKCLAKMSDAATSGRTVLFVSHSMASVRQLCSRAFWLEDGTVAAVGKTDEVIAHYLRSVLPADTGSVMEFETDPAKPFQMLRLRLMNAAGENTASFHSDEPIYVDIDSESREPIPELYGYFGLLDSNGLGTTILVSDSRDVKPNAFDSLPRGRHRHRITIPPRVLAPGEYAVSISFASTNHSAFIVEDPGRPPLKFSVSDLVTARGDSRGGYIGALLAWTPRQSVAADAAAMSVETVSAV